MKKKLILVKNVAYGYETIRIINNGADLSYYIDDDEYIKLAEVIDVDFQELEKETVINSEVTIIEKKITNVRANAEAAVTALERRKQELLAICHSE